MMQRSVLRGGPSLLVREVGGPFERGYHAVYDQVPLLSLMANMYSVEPKGIIQRGGDKAGAQSIKHPL